MAATYQVKRAIKAMLAAGFKRYEFSVRVKKNMRGNVGIYMEADIRTSYKVSTSRIESLLQSILDHGIRVCAIVGDSTRGYNLHEVGYPTDPGRMQMIVLDVNDNNFYDFANAQEYLEAAQAYQEKRKQIAAQAQEAN